MASGSAHIDYGDLVEQFCAVTGADVTVGQHLLEACNGDIEMAIGMHMDGTGSSAAASLGPGTQHTDGGASSSESATSSYIDSVRAPIPQMTEVLVENNIVFGRNNRRRKNNSVFDAFRDFQAEARQQMLVSNGDSSSVKRRTLEDLFRPPLDLLHKGSFRSSCDVGKTLNRWLLVNVQNVQEFACQMLNRDVWSHSTVKEVVRAHFVLWQVYSDSEEGKKYMQFYDVDAWPYIAVLDPRTGEKLVVWHSLDAMSFCEIVSEFLADHPAPNEDLEPRPEKRARQRDSIIDASEDSQLKAAIAASVSASSQSQSAAASYSEPSYSDDDDTDELETFTDSDSQQSSTTTTVATTTATDLTTVVPTTTLATTMAAAKSQKCRLVPELLSQTNGKSSSVGRRQNDSATCNGHLQKLSGEMAPTATEAVAIATDKNAAAPDWRSYLGTESDPASNIVFRFPDGMRKTLSLPCSSKLQALSIYIAELGFPADRYELVTTFPRRNLSALDSGTTLRDHGLYPQDTIFVQECSSSSSASIP